MARILITGGCGFVGSNLAYSHLNLDDEVIIFDNLSRLGSSVNLNWLESQNFKKLTFIKGDIRKIGDINNALRKTIDAVYHTAGQVAVTTSVEDPSTDFDINARGTFNVL